ncbi:DUF4158 domain-containing protein [Streptomyces sp. NRRL F-6674]|uniref:DUF4158 domain-containing protein n=1 Tax=Streptomyces sp. NRRL F-6674 TaxID=1463877 RepID=UPI001F425153|nr:DUF4158 domain-containing protein [Streptomyces sp. NRRL F-6674]
MDHFTLSGDEAGWLRNKSGATRLGFAVQLKFLTWRGRFPRMRLELPSDAVEHVTKQVGVAASELVFYGFTSRAAKRHRSELRDLTGWHECTKTDLVKLVSHLVDVIWHDERREEQVRAELLRQMSAEMIEPPTAAQIDTIIRSVLHQADERAVAEVAARLARAEDCTRRLDALVLTDLTGDGRAPSDATTEIDDEDDVEAGALGHQGPSGQRQPQLAAGGDISGARTPVISLTRRFARPSTSRSASRRPRQSFTFDARPS